MRPTGSPWDRAVVVPVEFVWAVHALPDGHPPGSEAIGPPFDAAAVPGVPALVVRPESVAGAYRLRSTYSTPQSMAFFPAEALLALYEVLGDMRRLMSLLALTTQGLLLLSVVSSVLILFRLLMPQFVTLRALGAPRRFVFAVAWGFTAVLVAIGVAAGIAGGYGVSFAISAALAAETGIALTPTLGWSELAIGAGILGIGLVLAALPAWIIQRRPLAEALISH
jgi:putative ABC transport system permease protein